MKIDRKRMLSGGAEFLVVLPLVLFLLSKTIFYLKNSLKANPQWLDIWHQCYILQLQITRLFFLNPGRIWDGGTCYPFNSSSLLFDEPSWGISFFTAPAWFLTKNIFVIFRAGAAAALVLAWLGTYYFFKSLGARRLWAFCAGGMFCLSGICLLLVTQQYPFWGFFLLPLLGMVTLRIFSSARPLGWGIAWGMLLGLLAWCSAHIFVMGGLFLCFLVAWNLVYKNRSRPAVLSLLAGLVISCALASVIFGAMFLTQKRFDFFRGYYEPFTYSSNLANLFYRDWPVAPFNPFSFMRPVWDYLKANAKGETDIGFSLVLFCLGLVMAGVRFWQGGKNARPVARDHWYVPACLFFSASVLAFLNAHVLVAKSMVLKLPLPALDVAATYLVHISAAAAAYAASGRIRAAMRNLDFFLMSCAFFFLFLAAGPFFIVGSSVIASPTAFLLYVVPGFSGIQATARWGLLFVFTFSAAVAVFISSYPLGRRSKCVVSLCLLVAFLEMWPGMKLNDWGRVRLFEWKPRAVDVLLRDLPGNGAVLEMSSYPLKIEHYVGSENSLGYVIFSRLYHKKPLVAGYQSYVPHVINRYLYYPKDAVLSAKSVGILRKFGAQFWVFHLEGWSAQERRSLQDSVSALKQIAVLDGGDTLVYEDPAPRVSLGYKDVL